MSTREATPSDKISEPPAYPVWWWIGRLADPPTNQDGSPRLIAMTVKCRTWFDARAEGSRQLGCEVNEVRIVQGKRDGVMVDDKWYDPNVPLKMNVRPSRLHVATPKPRTKRRK